MAQTTEPPKSEDRHIIITDLEGEKEFEEEFEKEFNETLEEISREDSRRYSRTMGFILVDD